MPKEAKAKAPKKEKKLKDPNAPKKPTGAYILFCNEERSKVKDQNPGIAQKDIMRKLGEAWKAADDATKEKFSKLAEKDKARYEEEMKDYVPPPEIAAAAAEKKKAAPKKKAAAKKAKKEEEEEEDEPEEEEDEPEEEDE